MKAGALPSLRSLAGGFQADSGQATLSYTQSGEVVRYLIGSYGADNVSALLAAMQQGNPVDSALKQIYGFDTDGLDAGWRAAQGAPVQATVAPAVTAAQSTSVPTLALWTAVPPVTATLPPSPSPRVDVPTATNIPAPLPTRTALPTSAPTQAAAPKSPGSPWLLGGVALAICALAVAAVVVGFRLAKGKT